MHILLFKSLVMFLLIVRNGKEKQEFPFMFNVIWRKYNKTLSLLCLEAEL